MLIVVDYEEENVGFCQLFFFSEKLQTNILFFSKNPTNLKATSDFKIHCLFTVFMKPWWKLIQSKKYQGLSYSYDKPCRQHSKPINFDKSWNIF